MAGPYYEIGTDVALMGDAYSMGDDDLVGDFMEIGEEAENMLALAGAGRRHPRLSALQAMLANPQNRSILRTRGPTKARTYPLGFKSTAAIAGGAAFQVTERPQVPFRGERLIVPSDIAGSFEITDVRVGKNSQFVSAQAVPARAFQEDATNTPLGLDTAQVSQDITIAGNNILGAPAVFRATIIGAAVE
jgi:hypothetical protein